MRYRMIASAPAILRKRRSGTVTRRRLRSQPRRSLDSPSTAEHARSGAGYPRIQPPSGQDSRFPSPIRPSPAVTSLPPIAVAREPSLGGSTARRGRTLRAIRRVPSVHIVGRFLDALSAYSCGWRGLPSPHPSRSGGSRSGASLGALLDAELRQDSGFRHIVPRRRELLQPDDGGPDGASRRCRGRGPRRPPTRPASARSWSRTGSSAARTASPALPKSSDERCEAL